jgi:hypothetical protein
MNNLIIWFIFFLCPCVALGLIAETTPQGIIFGLAYGFLYGAYIKSWAKREFGESK